jgi:hypothetical protein
VLTDALDLISCVRGVTEMAGIREEVVLDIEAVVMWLEKATKV